MTQTKAKPTKKIRFIVRSYNAPRRVEFSIIRNHKISDYVVEEGGIYDLPDDAIANLHAIKERRVYTDANGNSKTFLDQYYHCEPLE